MLSGHQDRDKAQRQNARQVAVQRQLEPAALARGRHRCRHDLLDQAPDRLPRFALPIRVRQPGNQSKDAVVIGVGHLRMDSHGGGPGRGRGDVPFQLLLPDRQLLHLRLDPVGRQAGEQGIHQRVLVLDDLRQLLLLHRAVIGVACRQAIALGDVFFGEHLHQVRIHQPIR
ncbi:hypothetical protein [Falsirhodobacter sp. 1013]|uniref:hypothetical protein n=1 Tax=Falsirhodobacter sp. 1013 TaxID=3417566 RepID=UPI003EB88EA3